MVGPTARGEVGVQVAAEAEEIAVAGVPGAERGGQAGQRAVLVTAAEQQLGGADRAGADKHVAGGDLALHALATGAGPPVLTQPNPVAAVAGDADPQRLGARPDRGAGPLGQRQVVQVQGVLRPHVAADVALPTERATALRHPEAVGLARTAVVERHRQVGVEEAVPVAEPVGRRRHETDPSRSSRRSPREASKGMRSNRSLRTTRSRKAHPDRRTPGCPQDVPRIALASARRAAARLPCGERLAGAAVGPARTGVLLRVLRNRRRRAAGPGHGAAGRRFRPATPAGCRRVPRRAHGSDSGRAGTSSPGSRRSGSGPSGRG